MPYCSTIELSANSGGTEVNRSAIGVTSNESVTVRIVPNANCSVESIAYTYQDYGSTQQVTCVHRTDASGAVTASFAMPPANVTLEIQMTADGAALHDVSFSGDKCAHALLTSSGGQSGRAIQAAAGETITVTVVPLAGYDLLSMSYTTRSNPVSVPLSCARREDGSFTAEIVMPDEPLYITADGAKSQVPYVSYDAGGSSLGTKTCEEYLALTDSSANWYDINDQTGGWYVVRGQVKLSSHTTLRVTGDVHLILCDGAKLTAGDGVYIRQGSSLSIYGQSAGTGKLVAKPESGPGIGGMANTVGGSLYIHGGVIEAEGGTNAAGIGGGNHESGFQNIVIYGGSVTAQGGSSDAGIGKGQQNSPSACGPIAIYGGTVNATGGDYGAGIGGGEDRDGGTIRIYGGTVTAQGGEGAAGIGASGGNAHIIQPAYDQGGPVIIKGGTVTAKGGLCGAGIGGAGDGGDGGRVEISGGTVTAEGGKDSAGIGGASHNNNNSDGNGGNVSVSGGTVFAIGGEHAAGIGGSACGKGGTFIISGGEVHATGWFDAAAIGGGYDRDGGQVNISGGSVEVTFRGGTASSERLCSHLIGRGSNETEHYSDKKEPRADGSLFIADGLSVYAESDETLIPAAERKNACQQHLARLTIFSCTEHEASAAFDITDEAHTGRCRSCNAQMEEAQHTYQDGVCTACGYAGSLVTIHYLRGNDNATGTMPDETCVPNGAYLLADCRFAYDGYEFAGWRLGDTETILLAGTEQRFDEETTFTATWRNDWSEMQAAIYAAESGAVVNYGTMTLSNGEITGNVSGQNGGGIWNMGTLHLNGGTITGNTANDKGAGIYARGESTLTLSGLTVITDNSSNQLGVNNLHINQDDGKLPAITAGDLAESSLIGVSCSVAPTASAPVTILSGVTGEVPQIFSDSSKCVLSYDSSTQKLYLATAPTYTVTVSGDVANGTVTAAPASACAGDTVTLTAEAEENYILESLTVTPEGGKAETVARDAETEAYRFTMPAANVTVSASFIQDKTSAAVQLVWNDGGSTTRPDTVYVTLLDLQQPVRNVGLTASEGWTSAQTGLPLDHNGELASYTFTIGDSYLPAGYSLTGSAVEGDLTTLTLTPAQPVTLAPSENGTVTAGKQRAAEGETVTLTVTPDPGYRLQTLTCTAGGEALPLTFDEAAGTYAFAMPAQAVTVTAGFEKIPTDWELLQALIDAAPEGGIVTLARDYTGNAEDASLHVVSGQKVTLDLNGFDLSGGTFNGRIFTVDGGELTVAGSGAITGGASADSVGGAFIVKGGGKLILNGGTIHGNTARNGGGVAVTNGTFVMNGGEISYNSTVGHGGGVQVQGSTFIMNGGRICVNAADGNGGGLWVGAGSTVRITGGAIENNNAKLGSDVYLNETGMAVSGGPIIGEAYVFSTAITVEGALEQDVQIGLTCSNSAAKNGVALTSGLSGNGALTHFTSVKNGYVAALNSDGEVHLVTGRTVTFDLNDGVTAARIIRVPAGTALVEPETPVRNGYLFQGWQLNGADYDFATPVTEDITLTAVWQELPPFGTPDFILPAGVTAVEESAFEGASMTAVVIPEDCTSIGDYAFRDCAGLSRIRIPVNCALGTDVFAGCGTVYVYGAAGSPAEAYCQSHGNCVFVPAE